jgi:hypothetical protein
MAGHEEQKLTRDEARELADGLLDPFKGDGRPGLDDVREILTGIEKEGESS